MNTLCPACSPLPLQLRGRHLLLPDTETQKRPRRRCSPLPRRFWPRGKGASQTCGPCSGVISLRNGTAKCTSGERGEGRRERGEGGRAGQGEGDRGEGRQGGEAGTEAAFVCTDGRVGMTSAEVRHASGVRKDLGGRSLDLRGRVLAPKGPTRNTRGREHGNQTRTVFTGASRPFPAAGETEKHPGSHRVVVATASDFLLPLF